MKKILLGILILPMLSAAEPQPQNWMERAKARGRDMFPSVGLTYYTSPMYNGDFSVEEKEATLDAFLPLTPIFTWTASYGLREQTWKTGGAPIIYKGAAYSVGIRLYWAPGQ